ncbi:methyltransferase domain-containing protein [Mycena sp. CBHHK59/15]|nr:methyltransferase domain-containing protein [Mycena sp. CBHHK59/15]
MHSLPKVPTAIICLLYALGFFRSRFFVPLLCYRVGTMGDGGKWVCGLERATHQPNCVIYSMGVERQSSFEQEVLRKSEGCHVYGFDFSLSEWGPELRTDAEVKSQAHFFPYKIGAEDNHTATPKEYSLQGIMKELGHEFIDIWKIDIEGSEFPTLTAVLETFKGQPLPFGQMQIELHVGYTPNMSTIEDFNKWWTIYARRCGTPSILNGAQSPGRECPSTQPASRGMVLHQYSREAPTARRYLA